MGLLNRFYVMYYHLKYVIYYLKNCSYMIEKCSTVVLKTHSFLHDKEMVIMVLCPDMGNIKLKKTVGSYLLHRIPGGNGILGPHPNSMGLNSF